jgi:predicted metal-dependent hydrolase
MLSRKITPLRRLITRRPVLPDTLPLPLLAGAGEAAASSVDVMIRPHPNARRLTLRVDAARGVVRLTVPPGTGQKQIEVFLGRHAAWARQKLIEAAPRSGLEAGAVIPFLGVPHRIRHEPALGRRVERQSAGPEAALEGAEAILAVGGPPEHVASRLMSWLKATARSELAQRAQHKAEQLGRPISRISIRDTRSRWGSCSATGALNFSWRLILAPEPVIDYVVAHEVAHLEEMNHSPAFWAVCERLSEHGLAPRDWLKRNGSALWQVG